MIICNLKNKKIKNKNKNKVKEKILKCCSSVGKAAVTTTCSISFLLLYQPASSPPALSLFAVGSGPEIRLKAEFKQF